MLDIIILWRLCVQLATNAKSKGYAGWPFVLMLIFSWILCGVTGFILAAEFIDWEFSWLIGYVAGVAVACLSSFAIVAILPDKSNRYDDDDRDYRRSSNSSRRSRRDDDDYDDDDRKRGEYPRHQQQGRDDRDVDDRDRDRDYR